MRKQLESVRTFDEQIHHVVGLVEQNAGVAPGALLVAPVGEFGGDHRIDVGADLRIAQHVDGIADGLKFLFKVFVSHVARYLPNTYSTARHILRRINGWFSSSPQNVARWAVAR